MRHRRLTLCAAAGVLGIGVLLAATDNGGCQSSEPVHLTQLRRYATDDVRFEHPNPAAAGGSINLLRGMLGAEATTDHRDFTARLTDSQLQRTGPWKFGITPHGRVLLTVRYGDYFLDPQKWVGPVPMGRTSLATPHSQVWIEVYDAVTGQDRGTTLTCRESKLDGLIHG